MSSKTAQHPGKLPSIHPGEILDEEFLRPMQITQYRLARAIGVDARRIHAIVHGERSISAETALLLSRYFGNSAELLDGSTERSTTSKSPGTAWAIDSAPSSPPIRRSAPSMARR